MPVLLVLAAVGFFLVYIGLCLNLELRAAKIGLIISEHLKKLFGVYGSFYNMSSSH